MNAIVVKRSLFESACAVLRSGAPCFTVSIGRCSVYFQYDSTLDLSLASSKCAAAGILHRVFIV